MKFEALLHDGNTSFSEAVIVQVHDGGKVQVLSKSASFSTARYDLEHWTELDVQPRLANTPRWIGLPDGSQLESVENDVIDDLQNTFQQSVMYRFIDRLERSWAMVFVGLIVTALFFWGSITYGVPAIAKVAAQAIPDEMLFPLGDQAQSWMDDALFEPSALSVDRQEAISSVFDVQLNASARYQLHFRKSPKIGANALALPNNSIILTDELVALAETDQQLLVILAHEVGHLEYKHTVRRLLQQAGLAAILVTFTGDISSVSSMVAYLPGLLLELGYSRAFEYEADAFAGRYMAAHHMDPETFVIILQRLHETHQASEKNTSIETASDDPSSFDYLSTHPAVESRIERIREFQR